MDISEALLLEHSKRQAQKITDFIGDDPARMEELMDIFFNGGYRLNQRASWVVMHCSARHKHLMYPYLEAMVEHLKDPKLHVAVRRNTVRIFQEMEVPEALWGDLFQLCYSYLNDPKETIAVRVFSMKVLFNIVKKEPDLAEELRLSIEDHLPYGSSGFKSCGKNILKALAIL